MQIDTRGIGKRAWWLGERYRGRLLDHATAARDGRSGRLYFLSYGDCARFEPTACAPELQLQEVSVCSRSGSSTLRLVDDPSYRHRVRAYASHGLLFVDIGQHDLSAVVGATHVRVFPGVGGARGQRLARRALLDLRPIAERAGRLRRTALPGTLLEKLARTEEVLGQTGSARAAARTLGIDVSQVRHRVELHRAVESLSPPVRSVTCPPRVLAR